MGSGHSADNLVVLALTGELSKCSGTAPAFLRFELALMRRQDRGVDERVAKIRTHDGREIEAPLKRLRHIDYGYASTSHSSQGATSIVSS